MNYRNINEVQDLYTTGILKWPSINEAKDKDDKAKGADIKKTLNPNAEHFDVHYAEEIKTYTNIFKHILVFTNDRDPKGNKTLKNICGQVKKKM